MSILTCRYKDVVGKALQLATLIQDSLGNLHKLCRQAKLSGCAAMTCTSWLLYHQRDAVHSVLLQEMEPVNGSQLWRHQGVITLRPPLAHGWLAGLPCHYLFIILPSMQVLVIAA